MSEHDNSANPEKQWGIVYKIGAWSSLILIVYSLITMIIVVFIGGAPESTQEAFELLQENRIVGLLRLDALTLFVIPLYYPLFLSIAVGLRKIQKGWVALGSLLAFAGITLFLATPSVFPLIPLSDRYAAAITATQKEQLLAAGEALIASDMWHSTGPATGGFLMLIAALILSFVMLKNPNFGKGTAIAGILTNGFDLLRSIVTLFAPQVGVYIMIVAGPLYLVWFPLLARDFLRLSRRSSKNQEVNHES
jgi:hypothetical protein